MHEQMFLFFHVVVCLRVQSVWVLSVMLHEVIGDLGRINGRLGEGAGCVRLACRFGGGLLRVGNSHGGEYCSPGGIPRQRYYFLRMFRIIVLFSTFPIAHFGALRTDELRFKRSSSPFLRSKPFKFTIFMLIVL